MTIFRLKFFSKNVVKLELRREKFRGRIPLQNYGDSVTVQPLLSVTKKQ